MALEAGFLSCKILVTGASGFIGQHLCTRLLAAGAKVHGLSREPRKGGGLIWHQVDAADGFALRSAFRAIEPDYVFHLAGHVMAAPAFDHVLPAFHANLHATVNLLTAAAETGCRRVILTGSLTEPEASQGEIFPTSPYAASKWAATGYARMFHALYGLPVVIARVFMVYGPGQKDRAKLIPYVTLSLLRETAPQISSGSRLIDWIYVDDVIDGFFILTLQKGLEGQTIDLGSGKLISIREIAERIERIIGAKARVAFGALADIPLDPLRVARVAETLERTLWAPKTTLDQGLQNTVDWFKDHRDD